MKRVACIFISAAALHAGPLRAQTLPDAGTRVRITFPERTRVIGTIRSSSIDSVMLANAAGAVQAIAQKDISALEVSLGRQRRFGRHFLIAVGAISAGGGMLSALTWTECTETGFLGCFLYPESRAQAFAWGAIAGAAVGVPVGLVTGLTVKVEMWQAVNLSASLPVGTNPRRPK